MPERSRKTMGRWGKPLIIGAVTTGLMLFIYRRVSPVDLSNACTIAGIVLLCIGGFRLISRSGFFDLPTFGVKKFWEVVTHRDYGSEPSPLGDFQDYLLREKKKSAVLEYLLTGVLFLITAALLLIV